MIDFRKNTNSNQIGRDDIKIDTRTGHVFLKIYFHSEGKWMCVNTIYLFDM